MTLELRIGDVFDRLAEIPDGSIDLIDHNTYRTSVRHRELADFITSQAGIDIGDVKFIKRSKHGWKLRVYKRRDGRRYLNKRGDNFASHWVRVPK